MTARDGDVVEADLALGVATQARDLFGEREPGPGLRAGRGGHFLSRGSLCRLATRMADAPKHRWRLLGMRLCRSVGGPAQPE